MEIKTTEGETQNVTSNAQGNLNTVLGAIGTAGAFMNGGFNLWGNRSNGQTYGNVNNSDPDANFVTRHELNLVQQLQAKDIQLASKDSQIALQQANQYTDQKIVDTYTVIQNHVKEIDAQIQANKSAQDAVNAQQMAWNATANGTMSTMATQIANQAAELASITTNVVPSNKVCDTGCCCNN